MFSKAVHVATQLVKPQPPAALAMENASVQATTPLGSLTRGSAKTADFLVRVFSPKKTEYSFKSKRDGKLVEKVRFSCILIGVDGSHYCEAGVKTTTDDVKAALEKFKHGTAWRISGVCFDGYSREEYLHTSVRLAVDLKRTRCSPVLRGTEDEKSLALAPAPQITIANVAGIKSKRCFDVIALVREISETRTPVGHPPVANVCLVDGTTTNTSKTAEVVVAVWGTENITLCQKHVGEPLLFLNVAAKHAGELELNLWTDRLIVADCQCEKMDSLNTKAAETGFADDRELLTSKHVSTWDPDRADQDVLNQEALMSCCALLQLASDDASVAMPQILQVNGMRLEEPEAGDSVVETTGVRLFFTTLARDFSCSCKVGVSEAAALSLSGLSTMAEFQDAHAAGTLCFPPFANCRIRRRTKEVTNGESLEGKTFVNTTVVAATPLSLQITQAPNTSHNTILEILKQCPESRDAMLAVRLSEVSSCPFYGLRVEYNSLGKAGSAPQPTRNCQVAVALACATQKSRCLKVANGFLVSTSGVKDALEDEEDPKTVEVRGYCSMDNVLEFKMDPPARAAERVCLLLITAAAPDALTVHSVTHIDPSAVHEAKYFIKKMRTLGMRAEYVEPDGVKRMCDWTNTPESAKRCRTLAEHPTGESL